MEVGGANSKAEVREESTTLAYRKVELGDIPLLRGWYSDPESVHQLYAAPEDETDFAYYMLQPHRFVLTDEGTPIGTFRIEEQGGAGVLGILVAPEARGRGIANAVLKFAEEAARALGFHVLSVDIYSDNEPALRAFSRAGFREFIWYEKNI
jgi:RimJ/RimL family protein N-acetyltransferase